VSRYREPSRMAQCYEATATDRSSKLFSKTNVRAILHADEKRRY
jgi:hypothetical protein